MSHIPTPDLAACANERIRVPGAIQPHGRMVVINAVESPGASGALIAWSSNWSSAGEAAAAIPPLQAGLDSFKSMDGPASLGRVQIDGQSFDVAGHRSGDHLILEYEPAGAQEGLQAPIYSLARRFLPALQRTGPVSDLCALAAAEMKQLTGFGRSLVYRFDESGHGEVLAEVLDAGYDSYANHRFPGSDIPSQARELYRLNHIRLIPDAGYTPVPLVNADGPVDAASLDLSFASLRSVSPVHLEYMVNMGTLASMSVSIVLGGKLWGLISCHNHEPRNLSFETRVACEHLGRLLSLQIAAKEDNAEVATRLELRKLTLEIVSHLSEGDGTLERLVAEPAALLRLARATGAAVVLDEACWTVGDTPSHGEIHELAAHIAAGGADQYSSDRLAEDFAAARDWPQWQAHAAGVMAISISQVHRHQIIWFRPEIVQTIQWAGDPRKEVRSQDGRIHPRRSFASWKEQVRGRSELWSGAELGAALELRQALIGIVLRRAEEMAEVAAELGRVNKELEAFSYTVSHDLRAPMRHIAGYVDLVLDGEGKQLGERSQRYLSHVKDAAAYAGQLVDALLDFSRMGRAALKRRDVDTQLLVEELAREMSRLEPGRAIEWDIRSPLPVLWADPLLMQITLRNLLGNAVKYTRRREPARIRVAQVRDAQGVGIEVTDNGVGFPMKYAAKLFGVFQRLHQAEDFEGTGIGLASVRRIVERHGGKVWADGEVDKGARVGFTLPEKKDSKDGKEEES